MKKLILVLFIPLIFACSGGDVDSDDSNNPCPNQPQLTTLEVSNISIDENTDLASATFSSEIQNIQLGANCETFSITNQGFVYSTSTQPTTSHNVVNANGENASADISDLMPETTYYVRAYLTNSLGTFYGNEVTFTTPDSNNIENALVSGFAQKGPFLNGSSIILSELDENFNPTGLNYTTQIIDNSGEFELSGVSLVSQYATLRVDGFYFNEVCGVQSNSQITLNAISNISDVSNINLNVLTHLEKARVEYLISNNSSTLEEAKSQAQSEILSIFNISETIDNSENLNISGSSQGDAILIAISSILQGIRTEAEFSEIMANISTDIRTDGELNSETLGSQLISQAILLNPEEITNNIEERYENLGIELNVPDFSVYIQDFISNSSFEIISTSIYEYPLSGSWGVNILNLDMTGTPDTDGDGYNDVCVDMIDFESDFYSLKAIKNTDDCSHTQLKVKISLLSENDLCNENVYCWPWWFVKLNDPTQIVPIPDESSGWTTVSTLDLEGNLPLADELILNSDYADIGIMVNWESNWSYNEDGTHDWYEPVIILIEYFENNMTTPTFSKELVLDCHN